MVNETKKSSYYKRRLKESNPVVYDLMKSKMNDPLRLTNDVIRHYQWILQHGDISNLNLTDQENQAYCDLFIYAITSSKSFADEFYNYFINSIKTAYDLKRKKWKLDILLDIFVNSKRLYNFDLAAMYILVARTIDSLQEYINQLEMNPEIPFSQHEVVELLEKIVDQEFYDEIRRRILRERETINTLKYA